MKKGVIAAITVVICAVLAATYTFAAPTKGKEKKAEETTVESTTTEKKEATTQEKKTATETTEAEKEAKEKVDVRTDDAEENTDQEEDVAPEDNEEYDEEDEIDDEKIDHCNHEWSEPSYAIDPESETGYIITQYCKKCNLVKDTPISFEEYEEVTKDQEPREEDCEYEDNDNNDNAEEVE